MKMMNKINELEEELQNLKKQNEKMKLQLNMSMIPQKAYSNDNAEFIDSSNNRGDKTLYESMFLDNVSVMLLINPFNGKIIDANKAAIKFYGYSLRKILSMNIADINVLSSEVLRRLMDNGIEKRINTFLFQHKLANGELRDVEVVSSPIEINDKKYLHSIIYDETEKYKKIKALYQSEQKFQQLFNNVNDALLFFKVDKNNTPSKFVEVNDIACRKLGYTYEEMLNLSPFEIDTNSKESIIQMMVDYGERGGIPTFETDLITKDGRLIPTEINTHFVELAGEKSLLAVGRDITHRREIEQNLRQSIEKQEKIMSFLPDAVFIIKKNRVLFVNEYGSNLLGYNSPQELIGKNYLSITLPEYHGRVKKRIKQMNDKNIIAPLVEEKYIKKNGEILDVEVTGVKIPFENSSAFLVVARDISQRKKVKSQLDEKIEFEKLRTEFFANISHELRTPLNVILGSLQLLDLYDQEDINMVDHGKYKTVHKKMKQNCFRLLRLVNNIIDMTKIDAGFYSINIQKCDIVSLIRSIVFSVEDYVKNRNLNISFDTSIDELIIGCDPEKIERILLNLLSNAIKFTEVDGNIQIIISKNAKEIHISVKDTGIGIPEENLKELFNRFTQVDKSLTRNREGSGIGLSLVESLIKLHEGSISVESQLGKGTEFKITLPMLEVTKDLCHSSEVYKSNLNIESMHIEFSDIYSL